jgi:hypothetical protein
MNIDHPKDQIHKYRKHPWIKSSAILLLLLGYMLLASVIFNPTTGFAESSPSSPRNPCYGADLVLDSPSYQSFIENIWKHFGSPNWSQRREMLIILHERRELFNELIEAKHTGRVRLERLVEKLDPGSDFRRCAEDEMKSVDAEIMKVKTLSRGLELFDPKSLPKTQPSVSYSQKNLVYDPMSKEANVALEDMLSRSSSRSSAFSPMLSWHGRGLDFGKYPDSPAFTREIKERCTSSSHIAEEVFQQIPGNILQRLINGLTIEEIVMLSGKVHTVETEYRTVGTIIGKHSSLAYDPAAKVIRHVEYQKQHKSLSLRLNLPSAGSSAGWSRSDIPQSEWVALRIALKLPPEPDKAGKQIRK